MDFARVSLVGCRNDDPYGDQRSTAGPNRLNKRREAPAPPRSQSGSFGLGIRLGRSPRQRAALLHNMVEPDSDVQLLVDTSLNAASCLARPRDDAYTRAKEANTHPNTSRTCSANMESLVARVEAETAGTMQALKAFSRRCRLSVLTTCNI